MAKISEAKKRADAKYRKEKTHLIQLQYPVERYNEIKDFCDKKEVSVATWCKSVIDKAMKEDLEA